MSFDSQESLIEERIDKGLEEVLSTKDYKEAWKEYRRQYENIQKYLPEKEAHKILDGFEKAALYVNRVEYRYIYKMDREERT